MIDANTSRRAVALVLALSLAACTTPYQSEGGLFLGGVRSVRIDEDTLQITSRVNSMTSADLMEAYLLRKCAEETLRSGYDLFAIVSSANRSTASDVFLPGVYSSRTSFSGHSLHTGAIFLPAQSLTLVSPGEAVFVKMARGHKSQRAGPGVFDAREVLTYLASSTATARDQGASPQRLLAQYPDTRPAGMGPVVRGVAQENPTPPPAAIHATAPPPAPQAKRRPCAIRSLDQPDAVSC